MSDRRVAWIRAQLDATEAAAKAAYGRSWLTASADTPGELWVLTEDMHLCEADAASAEHIVLHDPAAVLADVEAKRAILDMFAPTEQPPKTDAELHARFAHPEWEYATTEGPRKAWDDADVPPDGEGWELNIDAGRAGTPDAGWDRFDYTEEAYWRRRLPADEVRKPGLHPVIRLLAEGFRHRPGYEEAMRDGADS